MDSDISNLWVLYKEKESIEARDALILNYAPVVKYIANRLAINLSTVVETGEFVS